MRDLKVLIRATTAIWVCLAAEALGQTCPTPPDNIEEQALLFEALHTAQDAELGNAAANAIWQLWFTAPDPKAQDLLDRGVLALRQNRYQASETILAELTVYCPHYAEGWNQRAFARFLKGDHTGSQDDIAATLELEPLHFGALSGEAMILIQLGQIEQAKTVLKRARAINPWLK